MIHRPKKRQRGRGKSDRRAVNMLPVNRNIVRLREDMGLKQTELAARLGVDKSVVWHWENGHSTPSITRLADVATALDVTVDELIAEAA